MENHIHHNSFLSRKSQQNRSGTVTGPSRQLRDAKSGRAKKFLHGITLVLRHHSCPERVVSSFNKQAFDYLKDVSEEVFLKRAKYILLVPMAIYLRNEMPLEPDVAFRPKGAWKRWSRTRLHHYSKRNTHLWYSFLQAKRAAEPVTPEIVLSNFRKHRSQMESPDPLVGGEEEDELLDEVMENLEPVLERLSMKMFQRLWKFYLAPGDFLSHTASKKASFESSRKLGGAAGELRRQIRESPLPWEELSGMRGEPGLALRDETLETDPVEIITEYPEELAKLSELVEDEISRCEEIPVYDAKIEAVLEPLKVRTISKGPSLPYYIGKKVQKALHSEMRKIDCFRLIGKPFNATDLYDIREAQAEFGNPTEEEWLSIDYSAATDGLSARLSQTILKRILSRLSLLNSRLNNLLLGVLAPHHIHYPTVNGVTLEPVLQQNGQLMGSILSFPILCLANLGLYLMVRKRLRPRVPLRDKLASVLINGDDMLYIGNRNEWHLHADLGQRIGLAISPGKAYVHKRYANVNSVSTDFDIHREGGWPAKVGFFNVGLFLGNHKVLGKVGSDDEPSAHPFSSVITEVGRGAWKGKSADVIRSYLALHKGELRKECQGRNLFLPCSVGGMGQESFGLDPRVTRQQRKWAGHIMSLPYFMVAERPLQRHIKVRDVRNWVIDPVSELPAQRAGLVQRKLGPESLTTGIRFGVVPGVLKD